MKKEQSYKIITKIIIGLAAIIGITWISLTGIILYSFQTNNIVDISRRVTAPNKQKTAILVRDMSFDLNFKLYLVDNSRKTVPFEIKDMLWVSRDYDPSTQENWKEDIEWSKDSFIISVLIQNHYVFAYDFSLKQNIYDEQLIVNLLQTHNK